MRSFVLAATMGLLVSLGAPPASAETRSKLVYSSGAWQVRVVAYDTGSMKCQARVADNGYSFSVWAAPGSAVRLQFYSSRWGFNDERATLKVRIDSYPSWRLSNAHLYKHSVLFNLPNNSAGSKFLKEVAYGNRLVLRSDSGRHVHTYTLYGSKASIRALITCVDALKGRNDRNPFD